VAWQTKASAGQEFENEVDGMKRTERKKIGMVAGALLLSLTMVWAAERPPLPFSKDGKFGYRDRKRVEVIAPKYDFANEFSEGFAAVGVGAYPGTKWGYIDLTGKMVIEPKFDEAYAFSEGIAAVRMGVTEKSKGQLGYIDKTGKYIVEPKFDEAEPFKDGRARVRIIKEGYGYINTKGEVVEALKL
jgi:hypothetical protein